MNLNKYKDETGEMIKKKGWDKVSVPLVWLLFTEEIGELASAIRQYKKAFKKPHIRKDKGNDLSNEFGDVFSYLFQLSHMLDIDLDEMWENHKIKVDQKKYNVD